MKLSSTLDQLLRLVIVPDEETEEESRDGKPRDPESRVDDSAAVPPTADSDATTQPEPVRDPGPPPELPDDEPWRPRYTPPEASAEEEKPAQPWVARFTPYDSTAPAPTAPEPEAPPEPSPFAERRPVDPQPVRQFEEPRFEEPKFEEPQFEEPEPLRYDPPAEPEPPLDTWQSRFAPPEPVTPELEPDPEPAPVPPALPVVTHELSEEPRSKALEPTRASERSRLEQLEAAIGVAESLGLGLHLGLAVERIAIAATQGSEGADSLREAAWLIERYTSLIEKRPIGADLHQSAARLARTGDAIQDMRRLASALDPGPDDDEPGRIRRLSD